MTSYLLLLSPRCRPVRSESFRLPRGPAQAPFAAAGIALLAALAGCASQTKIALVAGTVSMNGQPLPQAMVEFQPDFGAPSYGYTDAEGRFELSYQPHQAGALVGKHQVRITTAGEKTDPRTDCARQTPEIVPESYNEQTELVVEVVPGKNQVDLRIEGRRTSRHRRSIGQGK